MFKPKKKEVEPVEEVEEQEEELDEEDEEEEPTKPTPTKKITVQDVLLNHEERLKELEATLYRLKNI